MDAAFIALMTVVALLALDLSTVRFDRTERRATGERRGRSGR